ncbi:MAG: copper resistance D family protein [Gemmatimonadales bacterium]
MAPAEPLLVWTDPPREILGFLASYLSLGAVGFYWGVLRPALRSGGAGTAALADSGPRAARIGLIGALCGTLALLVAALLRSHQTGLSFADTMILQRGPIAQRVILISLVVAGFALAAGRNTFGWCLAAVAALVIQLNNLPSVFTGRWFGIVNPVHVLGGSLWLGTLFVMMVAGVGIASSALVAPADRDAAVAMLVRKFSAIALTGAGLLGVSGVTTAWQHLHRWSSLWTTPYGWTLDAKLAVVCFILGLGYYHWRKAGPNLNSSEAVATFKITAWRELKLAGLVLLITSVLVSLPSPRSRAPNAKTGTEHAGPGGPGGPGGPPPGGDHD